MVALIDLLSGPGMPNTIVFQFYENAAAEKGNRHFIPWETPGTANGKQFPALVAHSPTA
jgi:hypothetical protein